MKVALGTTEVSDETRRAIRAQKGEKGLASRNEVKEYFLERLENTVVRGLTAPADTEGGQYDPRGGDQARGPRDIHHDFGSDLPQTTYNPSGVAGEGLPEPTAERGDNVGTA